MDEQNHVRVMEVVPYNPDWKKEYISESKKICNFMSNEIINIYHVGSTSIPEIYAKPVIDILIEVKEIEHIDNFNSCMEDLGYTPCGEAGIKGRRYFFKGLYKRTHHVHIFQTGNLEIDKHISFRDYMITHPEDAKRYEKLKKGLAIKFRYDSRGYVVGKDAFIKDIDRKAAEWAKYKQISTE
jgi:GrpB-like predicted nucleotidyltransferase (UPF0157 family)